MPENNKEIRKNENVYQMTFDAYDRLIEVFEKMHTNVYYPTLEQLDLMEKNPEKWLLFACYLSEQGRKPKNKDEEYRKKNLSMFIQKHLELVDDESEIYLPLPIHPEGQVEEQLEEETQEVI